MAQVDFNRFLAGQTVIYDYEIKEKMEDNEGKVRGLIALYTGKEMPVKVNDGEVTVELEPEMTYNQRWLMTKRQIARELIDNTDIREILYLERYNKEILEPKTAGK
jgi:FKBP-type peptidyl-prolyl cis-trans isomerase SlyD